MTRKEGEILRLRHAILRARASLEGLEIAISLGGPIGYDVGESVVSSATAIFGCIAKHDAFELAERDASDDASDEVP